MCTDLVLKRFLSGKWKCYVEIIPDRTSFRWTVRWDSGCVPVTRSVNSCRSESVCVCLRVGPMGVGCAGCCSIFGEVESLGCCSIFGEVESLGLVAESFSLTLFCFPFVLIITHSYSFLLFCPVLYAWSSDLDQGYSLVLKSRVHLTTKAKIHLTN